MRIAISGSHGTGKSTLVAAFLERRPGYVHEPEAFETLADDVDLAGDGPTPEALEHLIRWTIAAVSEHGPAADVIHERTAADYLAYAAASRRSWGSGEASDFVRRFSPLVADSLAHLDLIAVVPVCAEIAARPDEDARFRRRVDRALRGILLDDELDILGDRHAAVIELPSAPERRRDALLARVPASASPRAGRD